MQASSSEFSTDLIFWKKTWSRTLKVLRCDASVVNSSVVRQRWVQPSSALPETSEQTVAPTVYDGLSVHLPGAERGHELRRHRLLPVLAVTHVLLHRYGVRQQRQRRVHAPAT